MNNFTQEIWRKKLTETLEAQTEFLKQLNQERLRKEAAKINKRILEAREQIKNMTAEELAEILVAFENKTDEQENIIKDLKKSIKSLDKIKNIIIREYGLEEY